MSPTDAELAYCGLDCSKCPAYTAGRNGDRDLQASTAARWTDPDYPVQPEDIDCDGCKAGGRIYKWCNACSLRACASGQDHETCATCHDYGCAKMEHVLSNVGPEARANLKRIREQRTGP